MNPEMDTNKSANDFHLSPRELADLCCDDWVAALVIDIAEDQSFKRLSDISFLGAIHYGKKNLKAIGSRYQHSLGVARLALEYAKLVGLRSHETGLLVASSLLHDIGHAPLSHSLEPAFKELYGLNHHAATKQILRGEAPIGRAISKLLKEKGLDVDEVIELIQGEGTQNFASLFKAPINIDTIDGVLRVLAILQHKRWNSPLSVLRSLVRNDRDDLQVLDDFWKAKDIVYTHFICQPSVYLSDILAQDFLKKNQNDFSLDYFYLTDSQLKKNVPRLFELLSNQVNAPTRPEFLAITQRRFLINESKSIQSSESLGERYYEVRNQTTKKVPSPRTPFQQQRPLWIDDDQSEYDSHPRTIFAR